MSARDTLAIFAASATIFPPSTARWWERGSSLCAAALGQTSPVPIRDAVASYAHAAGIESGYGFFAPNVPDSYKLVFEFEYPDGHRETDVPVVSSATAGLRLAGFLDQLAATHHAPLQELLVRIITTPTLVRHHGASGRRAVLGVSRSPDAEAYSRGERESYDPVFIYDFPILQTPAK